MMLYCNWLSRSEGRTPCYRLGKSDDQVGSCDFRANGYRLATEAEWEHSFRDGTTTEFVTGDDVERLLDYGALSGAMRAAPREARLPNTWGLFDLLGNQWEVCWGEYPLLPGEVVLDPSAPSPRQFRAKGGVASGGLFYVHASDRLPTAPDDPGGSAVQGGFRVVHGPDEPAVETTNLAAIRAAVSRGEAIPTGPGPACCSSPSSPVPDAEAKRLGLGPAQSPEPRSNGRKSARPGAKVAQSSRITSSPTKRASWGSRYDMVD